MSAAEDLEALKAHVESVAASLAADPLVQVAVAALAPAPTRAVLATVLQALDAEFANARAAGHSEGYAQATEEITRPVTEQPQ